MLIENPVNPNVSTVYWNAWENISEDFKPVIEKMFMVLLYNFDDKDLSYRDYDDLEFYIRRLRTELEELENNPTIKEACDVANFGLMLVYHLMEKEYE